MAKLFLDQVKYEHEQLLNHSHSFVNGSFVNETD